MEDLRFQKIATIVLWGLFLAIGFSLRFPDLGRLGFWGDEGYTAIAVKSILEKGYPELPSGGIYIRSVPFLYLEALSAKMFGLNEFSLRLPNVIINLASVFITYLLGKQLFGKLVGLVAAFMMMFSNWEIEFSRYARMYAMFQFVYLSSLYVFYRGFVEDRDIYKGLTGPLWLLALLVHELGLVLGVILLIPLFMKNYAGKKWILLCGSVGFGLAGVLYLSLEEILRFKVSISGEMENALGPGVGRFLPVQPLDLLLTTIEGSKGFVYGLVVAGLVGSVVLVRWSLLMPQYRTQYLYLILIMFVCFLHQIGLGLVLLFTYTLFFFKTVAGWRERPFLIGCSIIFLSSLGWVLYGLSEGLSLRRMIKLLFQYPYLHERFLQFFIQGWPVEIALGGLGAVLLWIVVIKDRDHRALFSLASFIGPLLFVSFLERSGNSARYSFHLFPVMLMWGAYSVVYGCNRFFASGWKTSAIVACVIILLIVPSGSQVAYSIAIINRSYGDGFDKPHVAGDRAYPFYPDYKTTSSYIKERLLQDDIIVSMREVIPLYYVGRVDYLWIGDGQTISPRPGTVPRINNIELHELLENEPAKRVWLLADPFRIEKLKRESSALPFLNRMGECMVYKGKDGQTSVYLFSSDKQGQRLCSKEAAHKSDSPI